MRELEPALLGRARGALLGQLCGDALGTTVEFRGPEAIAADTLIDEPVLLTDMSPTLLALLDVPAPETMRIDAKAIPLRTTADASERAPRAPSERGPRAPSERGRRAGSERVAQQRPSDRQQRAGSGRQGPARDSGRRVAPQALAGPVADLRSRRAAEQRARDAMAHAV